MNLCDLKLSNYRFRVVFSSCDLTNTMALKSNIINARALILQIFRKKLKG
ncbi:MAG TPA: hypothetical protein TECP_00193 [Hyphomicrobiaceae bacterium MAG_BT-2024]